MSVIAYPILSRAWRVAGEEGGRRNRQEHLQDQQEQEGGRRNRQGHDRERVWRKRTYSSSLELMVTWDGTRKRAPVMMPFICPCRNKK